MAYLGDLGLTRSNGRYVKVVSFSTTVRAAPGIRARTVYHSATIDAPTHYKARAVTHTSTPVRCKRYFKRIPWWTSDPRVPCTIPTTGELNGVLKRAGVALGNSPVTLYYRKNGAKIEACITSISGAFMFKGLDPGDYYTIIAGDTVYPPSAYNAQVYDFLTPVEP